VENQPPIAPVGNKDGIRHAATRRATTVDAVLPSALVGTVTHAVGALTCMVALRMHVPLPVCVMPCVDGTRTGDSERGEKRVGGTPAWNTPAQRSTRPWGHGSKPISLAQAATAQAHDIHLSSICGNNFAAMLLR
jgi:hypothetical protein